ncbi:type II secretion system F family protein [Alkaliphilus pronyensis]|uniref:Type II secretion system F family protein n=1 Tax=Alkaliphilus pronyensis TaxID=1482732 RepID=A0A6I0F409_9FIRM|nr:type II secretion system F family protein [Alkaliphilus pronyensis]KAB3537230.1 type II secretion system F family protein [Alkaliphilus pronyensis]
MKLVFFIGFIVFVALYTISRNKAYEVMQLVDSKEYPLKKILPIGLVLLDLLNYRYNSSYDKRLHSYYSELYGIKNSRLYLKIHWANLVVVLMLEVLIISLYLGVLNGSTITPMFIVVYIMVVALTIYGITNEVKNKVRRRQLLLKLDFTEFINRIALLIDAGLTISAALEKINLQSNRPLYKEIDEMIKEIQGGKTETEALENFAHRCKVPEIFKFVSIILQTIKKGNSQTASMLRLLSNECWSMRKNTAKILGEEASTKLLFPMMIILSAILIIVITPAVLALSGM